MKRRLTHQQKGRIARRHESRARADDLEAGTIIAHHGQQLLLETPAGGHIRAHARRTLGSLTTGDRVGWLPESEGRAAVEALQPRKNVLIRPDTHGKARLMAANIDQVLIVIAPVPLMNPNVIERAIVATMDLPATPVLVLNKHDMLDQLKRPEAAELEQYLALWTTQGTPLYRVSAKTGVGMDALRAALDGNISLMVGLSGVGKTSLTRELVPEASTAEIRALSEHSQEGQHTTRTSRLYRLPSGTGALIDAPGVRDFSLTDLTRLAIDRAFPDITDLAAQCRFNNCQHLAEPQCAVREALAVGRLDARRFDNYLALREAATD